MKKHSLSNKMDKIIGCKELKLFEKFAWWRIITRSFKLIWEF